MRTYKVVARPAEQTGPSTSKVTSTEAIRFAEALLGGTWNSWPVKTEYFIKDDDSAVLTHVVQIQNEDHWYEGFIDAQTGELVNVIDFVAEAAYRVVPFTKQDPTWGGFSLLTNPQDATGKDLISRGVGCIRAYLPFVPSASPNGWHQDTSSYTTTKGYVPPACCPYLS